MKRASTIGILLIILLLFSACGDKQSTTPPDGADVASSEQTPSMDTIDARLSEHHLDVLTLPILDIAIETQAVFDDRSVSLEDSIDNELEHKAYLYYYNAIAGDFDQAAALLGENPALQGLTRNEEANFDSGIYMLNYTIHEFATLTAEDLLNVSELSLCHNRG